MPAGSAPTGAGPPASMRGMKMSFRKLFVASFYAILLTSTSAQYAYRMSEREYEWAFTLDHPYLNALAMNSQQRAATEEAYLEIRENQPPRASETTPRFDEDGDGKIAHFMALNSNGIPFTYGIGLTDGPVEKAHLEYSDRKTGGKAFDVPASLNDRYFYGKGYNNDTMDEIPLKTFYFETKWDQSTDWKTSDPSLYDVLERRLSYKILRTLSTADENEIRQLARFYSVPILARHLPSDWETLAEQVKKILHDKEKLSEFRENLLKRLHKRQNFNREELEAKYHTLVSHENNKFQACLLYLPQAECVKRLKTRGQKGINRWYYHLVDATKKQLEDLTQLEDIAGEVDLAQIEHPGLPIPQKMNTASVPVNGTLAANLTTPLSDQLEGVLLMKENFRGKSNTVTLDDEQAYALMGIRFDRFCHVPPGYVMCNHRKNRQCWLNRVGQSEDAALRTGENLAGYERGGTWNIKTNVYDQAPPPGILRRYVFNVIDDYSLKPDGVQKVGGKTVNGEFPGTRLLACWGDDIEVMVNNRMAINGTTIHWHGMLQRNNVEMDGVNGVTQCAVPPGESMMYRMKASQYGDAWYHSHYSTQYADGVLGPIKILGPTSMDWDYDVGDIIVSDWVHQAAIVYVPGELAGNAVGAQSLLMNGAGNFKIREDDPLAAIQNVPGITVKYVRQGRYTKATILNASFATHFQFLIDSHRFAVIATDFVPVHPKWVEVIDVAIGQRYTIVIDNAKRTGPEDPNGNYWMRVHIPENVAEVEQHLDERLGILRYDLSSVVDPEVDTPEQVGLVAATWEERKFNPVFHPIVAVDVPPPVQKDIRTLRIGITPGRYYRNIGGNTSRWAVGHQPFYLTNWTQPMINHWNDREAERNDPFAIDNPRFYEMSDNGWTYGLLMTNFTVADRSVLDVPHPFHLHGHDFVLLGEGNSPFEIVNAKRYIRAGSGHLRRDVVLVPPGGWVLLAWRNDNPGPWLFHCHIALHVAAGLAVADLELDDKNVMQYDKAATTAMCAKWRAWQESFPEWEQSDAGV